MPNKISAILQSFNNTERLIHITSILLFIFTFYFWFPGSLSLDSWDSWTQAKSGNYNDHHPTIMAFVWRILELILPGPWNMLLFHLLLFWGALTLITLSVSTKFGRCSILLLFIGLTPPVFGNLGVIWKDIGFGSAFLMATAMCIYYQNTFKKRYLILALISIVYAISVRHNGLPASVPFLISLINTYSSKKNVRVPLYMYCFTIITTLLFIKVGYGTFQSVFLRPEQKVIEQHIMFSDLAGLSAETGKDLLPEEFKGKPFTQEEIAAVYYKDNRCSDEISYGGFLKIRPEEYLQRKILSIWIGNVVTNPTIYLAHRTRYFIGLLGYEMSSCRSYHLYFDENLNSPSQFKNRLRKRIGDTLGWYEGNTPIFQPWFSLALCFACLWLCIPLGRTDEKSLVVMLSTSGVVYFLPYFFLSLCCDFRYAWWMVIASYVSFLILVFKYIEIGYGFVKNRQRK